MRNYIEVDGSMIQMHGIFLPYIDSDNMPYVLSVTGRVTGTVPTNGTMVFSATEDLVVTGYGDVVIVSTTRAADSTYRRHTVVISCPNNGSGKAVITGKGKIVSLGSHQGPVNPTTNFYTGMNDTAPILTWNLDDMPTGLLKIRQSTAYTNILPTSGTKALPTGLTFLWLEGNNIAWTYTGALPTGLTYLRITSNNFAWTYTGALPTGLTHLRLSGANIAWTGTEIGRTTSPPNMSGFQLLDYRNPPYTMDYPQLLELLDGLINRVGTLPAAVVIREQIPANVTAIAAATANVVGTEAEQCKYYINLIKSTKDITSFNLNTTII